MTAADDRELRDAALLDEIHLVGELIVAASASDGPLTGGELDEALGIDETARSVPAGHRPAAS